MIKFGDKFEAKYTGRGWTLAETKAGKDKDGNPKEQIDETYHGTIVQVCDAVLNKMAGNCETAEDIIKLYSNAREILGRRAMRCHDCMVNFEERHGDIETKSANGMVFKVRNVDYLECPKCGKRLYSVEVAQKINAARKIKDGE